MQGTICKYDQTKKYGFIRTEQQEDIFFHISDVTTDKENIRLGSTVSFDVAKRNKGPAAKNIIVTKQAPASATYSDKQTDPFLFFFGALIFLTCVSFFLLLNYSPLSLTVCYFLATSIAAFILCGYDKSIAGSNSTRVPEVILYLIALIGGSGGLLLGMKLFRHKTKKASFHITLAIVLFVQIMALNYISPYFKGESSFIENQG